MVHGVHAVDQPREEELPSVNTDAMRMVLTLNRATSMVIYDLESTVHRPRGLTWPGFRVIFALWLAGPMEAKTTAEISGMSRAALSALGVAIGIASMVAVLGVSESSKADLLAALDRLGTNLLEVEPGQTFGGEEAVLPEEAPAMVRHLASVDGASATELLDATVRRTDYIDAAETGGIAVLAADTGLACLLGARVQRGAFLSDATARYPAVVLGSEAEGLGDAWRHPSVTPVRLPMLGVADSLNVSIAAAVLLYEARRQRGAP